MICEEIREYLDFCRAGEIAVCKDQLQFCDMVERIFREEDIYVDEAQLARYLGLQKHFPYQLLPWERCLHTLHNCTYRRDGSLRFPVLVVLVGRGAGKNGFLAFEDFCLLTPINGVKYYDIDLFATSEQQAKSTFEDVYNILEGRKKYFKNYFKWNLTVIQNIKTGSRLRYHTKAPNTKDGGRPGKVDFDEYHAYTDTKLIDVAVSGLGKKQHPRRTIISSQGDVRDGPLDNLLRDCEDILSGKIMDNGMLPFICRLDDLEEVKDEANWHKANPSLRFFPNLLAEMRMEYADYVRDPVTHISFMSKRMNRPPGLTEFNITEWDNLVAATKALPEVKNRSCVCGIDFAKTNDFVCAALLFKDGDTRYLIHHTWVCRKSRDLPRIKYPLKEAEAAGVLEYVNDVEISPEAVTEWIAARQREYLIESVAIDSFRYAVMRDALKDIGFSSDRKNIRLVRPSDLMKAAVTISYVFSKQLIIWGDSTIMRWYTWNVKAVTDKKGNINYEKIEPRSRKTDGFMAMAAAFTIEDSIKQRMSMKGRRVGTVT